MNETSAEQAKNHNQNDVKVNNQFTITINFGDSLNLLALIAGVFMIRKIVKRQKDKGNSI